MRPLSGRRMSRIIRMVVVFPAPFAPRKPKIAPSFTSMDKSLMTRNSANDLLMCSTTSPNVTAPRFFVSIPGLVIFYLPLINLLLHLDYYTRAIASLFYHFLSYAIMGGWIELKICNKEFIVTKISGFLEWLPELRMVELRWIDAIRRVFESYGFCSIETPSVEEIEVLLAKGETDKEIYVINRLQADDDISDARLGLHYDLTVPLARYVAEHFNDLVFPFKRYQIQRAWRGERPQEGRYREFRQCDIDVININHLPLQFDAEMPAIIYDILSRLQVGDFQIRVSNRKILEFPTYPRICSGGRYENLAGAFINRKLPGVGISLGLTRIFAKLVAEKRLKTGTKCPTQVLVVFPRAEQREEAIRTAKMLRERGFNVEMYHTPGKIAQQLRYASRKGIPYAWFPLFENGGVHEVKDMATEMQVVADPMTWSPME